MSKNISRRKRRLNLWRIIAIIIIAWLALTLWRQRSLKMNLEAKRSEYESEISSLEMDIEELEKEISESDSLQFIEKIAREELGMVKPREIIVIDKNKKQKKGFRLNTKDN